MMPKIAVVLITCSLCVAVLFPCTAKACLVTDAVQPADEIGAIEQYLPNRQTALLQEWSFEITRMRENLISHSGRYSELMPQRENMLFVSACAGVSLSVKNFVRSSPQDILMFIKMSYDKNALPQNLWLNIHSQSI